MKNIKPFKTSVEALYNADFSAFSAFESIGNESVRIFLNGRFYNAAPTDFLTNYLKDRYTMLPVFSSLNFNISLDLSSSKPAMYFI